MVNVNITILLIDDDRDDYEIFCLALKEINNNITCLRAGYCEDAIDDLAAKKIYPTYIFLDLNMPKMLGRECLVHLKKMEHLKTIPVIIYTTSKREQERIELLGIGADHYITKKNTIDELVKELKTIIPV